MQRNALVAPSLLVLSLALAGCGEGSSSVCGNAIKEDGEDCDRGVELNGAEGSNCSAECRSVSVKIPQLQVQWTILRNADVGYGGAACQDIGAKMARIQLDGPMATDVMLDCQTRTRLFSDKLPAGKYKATVTLLGADGSPVTRSRAADAVQVDPGQPVPVSIDFTLDDLLSPCTGSLRIFPAWGVENTWCAAASPAVDQQTFEVVRDGDQQPITGVSTTAGTPLDGTKAACYTPKDSGLTPDSAPGLDCGIYHVRIRGYANGTIAYCGMFDVFVGPGNGSQPWRLTSPRVGPGACD